MLQKVEQENDALRVTLEKTELDLALAQSRLQMFRQVSDALGCATNRGAASKSELKAALLRYNGGVDDFVNSLNLDGEVTYFVQAMRCILLPDAFEGTQQYIAQLSSMSGASDRGRVKLTVRRKVRQCCVAPLTDAGRRTSCATASTASCIIASRPPSAGRPLKTTDTR
jgi:hypothetical protein